MILASLALSPGWGISVMAQTDVLEILLASVSSGGVQGNRNSDWPALSADGRFTAFESDAKNLVPYDTNHVRDIFVRDRVTGETERVSVSTGGAQANSNSRNTSISADGRYVAFSSRARNLVSGDTNGQWDVFVHDREMHTTVRVSVSSIGDEGDRESGEPAISADGRFVAYSSEARNLVQGDNNKDRDIFVHELETGETTRISVASDGSEGDRDSDHPAISSTGRHVAFASEARNLVAGDTNKKEDIFVHDRESGETTRVSISSAGTQGNSDSETPAISAEGHVVAFVSRSSSLVAGDTNKKADVFVHDRGTKITERVSVRSDGGQARQDSDTPSISAGGRFVAFASKDDSLVDGDKNKAKDVFVRDRSRGLTIRIGGGRDRGSKDDKSSDDRSRDDKSSDDKSSDDKSSDDESDKKRRDDKSSDDKSSRSSSDDSDRDRRKATSDHPFISADGNFVGFRSAASDLVPRDKNRRDDIFLARLGLNRSPEPVDDASTAPHNTPVDIDVLGNDVDPDDDPLAVTGFTQPSNGTVERNPDGTLKYSPDTGFIGDDTFNYTVGDGLGGTATATVRVDVRPPPIAVIDDPATTAFGQSVDIDVLANDTGHGLSVIDVTDPANGASEIVNDTTVRYIPESGFSGSDSFLYTARDGSDATDMGAVNITVDPPPLTLEDDQQTTVAGEAATIDVLANDSGDSLTVTDVTDPRNGQAIINADHTITYTPEAGFIGPDNFEYTATDVAGFTATATVNLTVDPPPLEARDDQENTSANSPIDISVLANDAGTGITVTAASDPAHGITEILGGTIVRYTPDVDFVGDDGFEYTITGDDGSAATANVTVSVDPEPLVVEDDEAITTTLAPVVISVLDNDSGTAIRITDVSDPANGSAVINADDTVTYTSGAGFTGLDSFSYTIADVAGTMATANVMVAVDPPPNVPPEAVDDEESTFESVPVVIDVLENDSDPEDDPLTIDSVTPPANGIAVISGPDTVTYTPNPGFRAMDGFDYTILDGRGGTASASVVIDVLPDELPPRITATVSPLPNAAGWNASDVTVTFDCLDNESGIESCSDPVLIDTEGAAQQVDGTAIDRAGNESTTTVAVSLDKTAPSVSLSGPATARRSASVPVGAVASDALGLGSLRFLVDGLEVGEDAEPPFGVNVVVPATAATGSTVTVEAIASDLAGNTASSDRLVLEVLGGGYILGEVYDDTKGLPLAGVTCSLGGPFVLSDALGRFGLFTELPTVGVHCGRDGFTSVERLATLDTLAGTLILDPRLTPLAPEITPIDSSGGTASSNSFELTVPSGAVSAATDIRVTEVSAQGLRSSLPLGWSPAGTVQIDPEGVGFAVPADLQFSHPAISGVSLALVKYRTDLQAWVAEAVGLTGDDTVGAPIASTGIYAFVVADTGATAPPLAEIGQPLMGAAPVVVDSGLSASSEVTPEVSPVSPDAKATGSVVLFSPLIQPSGTVISARVEETFDSIEQGELKPQPFTQELCVYRFPSRPDGELHASFPVTPSRRFTAEDLLEGRVHVEIRTSPSLLRGSLVGGEGQVVRGEGDAELVVPSGALADTISAFVEALDLSELNFAPAGLTLVGAAEVDLAGSTLALGGSLSIPAPEGLTGENLFAARFVVVNGLRKLRLIGPASLADGRLLVTGVNVGGTYLFFQSSEPLALVQGTVSESGTPSRMAVVESSTSGFMDITADDGIYHVAAGLRETTLTARSLVTGNLGTSSISPTTTDPVFQNIELTTTGPFVVAVSPEDGERGIPPATAIAISFSEPVSPATVTALSLSLTKTGDGTLVEGRISLGIGNRSASFLPNTTLETLTNYELSATDEITDTNGNGLLPFTSTFTTVDLLPPPFDPDSVDVTFPDATGQVTVSASPGSFEGLATIFIINDTSGVVVSGVVNPDGGFSFQIKAAITDALQIRILDSADREVVIEKTEYQAADGSVAIGSKGGKVEVDDFVLEVPEGALPAAAVLKLTPLAQVEIDALPVPEGIGAIGSGVEVDTGGATLQKEADLSFPIPPAASPSADFLVVRKVVEDDLILYETIDSASIQDDKVVTDSFPFSGLLIPGIYMALWAPENPDTSRSPLGIVTGIAQETDGNPVDPKTVPLAGVVVRADKDLGLGDYTATTGADGRFTLWDFNFGAAGGTVNLIATDPKARQVQAIAFEDPGIFPDFPALGRYNKAGSVVFNFALSPPPPPPPKVNVKLFREDADGNEVEITNGFAAMGEEILIRVSFTQPPARTTAEINDVPVVVEKIDGFNFVARFTPGDARGYTLVGSAIDAFLTQISFNKSFLAVAGAGGNTEPLPGPPRVISDSTVPRAGQEGVAVSQIFQALFTEPVTNISESTVFLTGVGGTIVPIELIATDRDGVVGPATPTAEIVALTMRPLQGLRFSSQYEIVFTGDIVDLDVEGLTPDPTIVDFSTFEPEKLGEAAAPDAIGVAVVDNRAFVVLNTFPGTLKEYDLSDPTQPKPSAEHNFFFGLFRGIVAQEDVDLGTGPTDTVAVLSVIPRSGQGIVTIYDVGGAPPFPWQAVVTTTLPPMTSMGLALLDQSGYVAAGKDGLKVLDLNRAADLYRTTKQPGEGDPGFEISQALNTSGRGFAQESVLNTIALSFEGQTLRASSVAVAETPVGRTAFTSSFSVTDAVGFFSSVNVAGVVPSPVYHTLRLEKDLLAMGTASRIGLTTVGDKEIAIAVGASGSPSEGRLAVLDITEPRIPLILSIVPLQGTWGSRLAFDVDGTTLFIGTPQGVEIYNLTDPAAPQFAGMLEGLRGDVALAQGVAISASLGDGVQTAAARPIAFLSGTDPRRIVVGEEPRAAEPFKLLYRIIPPTYEVEASAIDFRLGENTLSSIPAPVDETGVGEVLLPFGFLFPRIGDDVALPQLVINDGLPTRLISQRQAWNFVPFEVGFVTDAESFEEGFITVDDREIELRAINEELFRRADEDGEREVRLIEWEAPLGDGTSSQKSLSDEGIYQTVLDAGTTPAVAKLGRARQEGVSLGTTLPVRLEPGVTATTELTSSHTSFPGDGATEITLTLLAKDQFGNPVVDGTPVQWEENIDGEFVSVDDETIDGTAIAVYRAGFRPTTPLFTAEIDGKTAELMLFQEEINVVVTPTVSTISIFNTDPVEIEAVFTSPGGPISDDAPFTWIASLGKIEVTQSLSNGVTRAMWSPAGGPYRRRIDIQANIEFWRGTGSMNWVPTRVAALPQSLAQVASVGMPPSLATLAQPEPPLVLTQVSPSVIAGDRTANGTVPLELSDGTIEQLPYRAIAEYSMTGLMPGEAVTLQLGTVENPNILPIAIYNAEEGIVDGNVVPDSTGAHDGVATVGVLPDPQAFRGDQGYSFDGRGVISIPDDPAFDFAGDFQVQLAVRPRSEGDNQVLVDKLGDYRINLVNEGDGFRARFTLTTTAGEESITSLNTLQVDTWHLLTARVEGSSLAIKLDSLENSAVRTGTPVHSTAEIRLGPGFNGFIDEIRIADLTKTALSVFPNGQQTLSFNADATGEFTTQIQSTGQLGLLATVASLTPSGFLLQDDDLSQRLAGGYFTETVAFFETRGEKSSTTVGYVANGLLAHAFKFVSGIWGAGDEDDLVVLAGDLVGSTVLALITTPRDFINAAQKAIHMQADGGDALDMAFGLFEVAAFVASKKAATVGKVKKMARLIDKGSDAAGPAARKGLTEIRGVLDDLPQCPTAVLVSLSVRTVAASANCFDADLLRLADTLDEFVDPEAIDAFGDVLDLAVRKSRRVNALRRVLGKADNVDEVALKLRNVANELGDVRASQILQMMDACGPRCPTVSAKAIDALAEATKRGVRAEKLFSFLRRDLASTKLLEKAGDFLTIKPPIPGIEKVLTDLGGPRGFPVGAQRVLNYAHDQLKSGKKIKSFEQRETISFLRTAKTGRPRARVYDIILQDGLDTFRVEVKRWNNFPPLDRFGVPRLHAVQDAFDQMRRDFVVHVLQPGFTLDRLRWVFPDSMPKGEREKLILSFIQSVRRNPVVRKTLTDRGLSVNDQVEAFVKLIGDGNLIQFVP